MTPEQFISRDDDAGFFRQVQLGAHWIALAAAVKLLKLTMMTTTMTWSTTDVIFVDSNDELAMEKFYHWQ